MVTLVFARILLEASANACAAPANFEGRTALGGAAEHGRLDVLQLLLNAGACHDRQDAMRAARLATKNGHLAVARLLLD
jgi:ankyrin repeat protein